MNSFQVSVSHRSKWFVFFFFIVGLGGVKEAVVSIGNKPFDPTVLISFLFCFCGALLLYRILNSRIKVIGDEIIHQNIFRSIAIPTQEISTAYETHIAKREQGKPSRFSAPMHHIIIAGKHTKICLPTNNIKNYPTFKAWLEEVRQEELPYVKNQKSVTESLLESAF